MSDRIQIQCPECLARIAISDATKLGKKIRCKKCAEIFIAKEIKDADEDESLPAKVRPKKGKSRKKARSNAVPLAIGGAVALLVLVGVVSILLVGNAAKNNPAAQNPLPAEPPADPIAPAKNGKTFTAEVKLVGPNGETKTMNADDVGFATAKDKLKRIGVASLNYVDRNLHFPAASSTDPSGKPLLSWRVHLLPFLGGKFNNDLYKEFHLDEPWDSPHNSSLITKPRMPVEFSSIAEPALTEQGKTRFLIPFGVGLLYEGMAGPKYKDIRATSYETIYVVEVSSDAAVVWTKPENLHVDLAMPYTSLKGARKNLLEPGRGFLMLLADGAVRFVKDDVSADSLKALFTRGRDTVGDY